MWWSNRTDNVLKNTFFFLFCSVTVLCLVQSAKIGNNHTFINGTAAATAANVANSKGYTIGEL